MPKNLAACVVDFSERYARLKQKIAESSTSCGRTVDSVKILAVSKGHSFAAIKTAYECGVRDFGESYAQEMNEKIKLARENHLHDICWHFIGGIQSNKIKIITQADVIHSVGSVRHAHLIAQQAEACKKIFCQVNLGQERAGFKPSEIVDAIKEILRLKNIQVTGLMTILPLTPPRLPEFWFEQMLEIKTKILASSLLEDAQLSMGMSQDFLAAIKYGANIIRIGSALFGARHEKTDIFTV